MPAVYLCAGKMTAMDLGTGKMTAPQGYAASEHDVCTTIKERNG
jgi:hypothetical protein